MIIDFHVHVYPPSFQRRREELCKADATFGSLFSSANARMASAPELVRDMDEAQVDAAVIMGIGWANQDMARESNDYILQATQEHPSRLVGFCSVNPAWGEDALKEVERCARLGARGVGELHPDTQGLDIADRGVMAPLMEVSRELGLVVLTHASEPVGHQYPGKGKTTPDKLWTFIQSFPDSTIVCAHWGGGLPFYALMPEVAGSLTNVYFDSAASPFLYKPSVFEAAVDLLGAEKVLLGSDYPLLPQRRLLAQMEESPLTPREKDLILGDNAKRLLGL